VKVIVEDPRFIENCIERIAVWTDVGPDSV